MQNLLGTKQGLAKPCRPTINNAPYQHYLSILPLLYAGLSPALSGQPVTHHAMIRIGNGEAASRERERASEDKKQSKQSKGKRRRPGSGPRPAPPRPRLQSVAGSRARRSIGMLAGCRWVPCGSFCPCGHATQTCTPTYARSNPLCRFLQCDRTSYVDGKRVPLLSVEQKQGVWRPNRDDRRSKKCRS